MRAIDISIHRGKTIGKTFGNERLGCEMVAFVKLVTTYDMEDARITFQAGRMQRESIQHVCDAIEPATGVFQSHAPHKTVNFITQRKQMFCQVTSVLTGESGN